MMMMMIIIITTTTTTTTTIIIIMKPTVNFRTSKSRLYYTGSSKDIVDLQMVMRQQYNVDIIMGQRKEGHRFSTIHAPSNKQTN
jgi:hypothetical protein